MVYITDRLSAFPWSNVPHSHIQLLQDYITRNDYYHTLHAATTYNLTLDRNMQD